MGAPAALGGNPFTGFFPQRLLPKPNPTRHGHGNYRQYARNDSPHSCPACVCSRIVDTPPTGGNPQGLWPVTNVGLESPRLTTNMGGIQSQNSRGNQNYHANTASRSTSQFNSAPHRGEPCDKDCMFLTLFCSTIYLPQEELWQLRKVPLSQLLLLTSPLRGQTLTMK
jgi:hypothetical protein